VAATDGVVCAIRNDGTIDCFGFRTPFLETSPTTRPIRQIQLGTLGGCASHAPDNAWSCGGVLSSIAIDPMPSLAVGHRFVCGLRADGLVRCAGQFERWTVPIPPGIRRQVVAGRNHACALDGDGNVQCWGNNDAGQTLAPVGRFLALSARDDHTCALAADGSLRCWGDEDHWGAHGLPAGPFFEIAVGADTSCAVGYDQKVRCWGPGALSSVTPPTSIKDLSIGETVACGLTAGRELRCWGDTSRWTIQPSGRFRAVQAGPTTCALREDGQLVCFGESVVNAENSVRPGTGP
jgi:hypothetical protein